ncbi:DUF6144 family protein [Clostridium sp. Marseille-QA1073]
MSSKCERILDSIRLNAGVNIYKKIVEAYGELPLKSSPTKQAKYIKSILNELENNNGENIVEKVMKPCGHLCISNRTIKEAKKLFERAENVEKFLDLMNEKHIGGGELHMDSGNIIGIYNKCYCGMAKNIEDMPVSYCNCSAGWFEKLFSSVFNKTVKVTKLHTILEGADNYVFKIEF